MIGCPLSLPFLSIATHTHTEPSRDIRYRCVCVSHLNFILKNCFAFTLFGFRLLGNRIECDRADSIYNFIESIQRFNLIALPRRQLFHWIFCFCPPFSLYLSFLFFSLHHRKCYYMKLRLAIEIVSERMSACDIIHWLPCQQFGTKWMAKTIRIIYRCNGNKCYVVIEPYSIYNTNTLHKVIFRRCTLHEERCHWIPSIVIGIHRSIFVQY